MDAMNWRKSSYSNGEATCVEVSATHAVLVRDTTDRDGATLSMPATAWTVFLATLR